MSRRKYSLVFALATALSAQSSFDSLNLKPGSTVDQTQRNLNAVSSWLKSATDRPQAAQSTLGYLNALRGDKRWNGNRGIGVSMSGLYRQLGGMQTDPLGAWSSFRSAYVILNQLQRQYPQDQQLRNDLGATRRSLEVVEARIPELPRMDWASLDPTGQKDYDTVMERFINVSASVSSAEVMAETMRRSMADQGLAVRPEVIGGLTRMKLKMEEGRRLIEQRRFDTAKDRLDSAGAEAQKILKSFGG